MTRPNILSHISPIDIFASVNLALFLFMCYAAYFDRFVYYRGYQYIYEFMVYAAVIIVLIFIAWKTARRFDIPGWLLAVTQIGIAMHFAGGFAFWHDKRLYDVVIAGIRYDKFVHFFNAAVAGMFVRRLPLKGALKHEWLCNLVTVLAVLGMGACVEIVEYLVMLTITVNGVGNYDNNMQDLIFNMAGVSCCVFCMSAASGMKKSVKVPTPYN